MVEWWLINILLFCINGLMLLTIIRKNIEVRLRQQIKKETLQLAYNRNWRNR